MSFWSIVGGLIKDVAKGALNEGKEYVEDAKRLKPQYECMSSNKLHEIRQRGSFTEKVVATKVLKERGEI